MDESAHSIAAAYGCSVAAGYRVHEAATADDALQVLEVEADLKLVFTDVTMPGSMDGIELAHHVSRRWPHIAIIVVSGQPLPRRLPEGARFATAGHNTRALRTVPGCSAAAERLRLDSHFAMPGLTDF